MLSVVIASWIAAQPANFALADLDCVLQRFSPTAAAQVVDGMDAAGGNPTEAILAPLTGAVDQCQRELGWSDEVAGRLTFIILVKAKTQADLEKAGVPVRALEEVFERQSDARKVDADAWKDRTALAEELIAGGVAREVVGRSQDEINFYIGYLLLRERLRRGLPLD
jgi:hypothetical protein